MRTLLLASLLACSGCIIAVNEDGTLADPPPPPEGSTPAVAEPNSEYFMLKYVKGVPEVYEGIKTACGQLNIRITDADTSGKDNWTVKGHHARGWFDLHVYMNRHDHKTRTSVTVRSARYTQFQCREWTRRIHAEIGKQIGETGR